MDTTDRRRVRRTTAGAVLLAGLALTAGACAGQNSTSAAPTVNVGELASGVTITGKGEVTGTPDTLTLSFGVSTQRPTVDQAVADNAVTATAVQDTLKANGIAEDQIQTRNYSVQANYRYEQGAQVPDGYRVDNTVTAKVKDLSAAGGLIDKVVTAGGEDVRVQGVSFSIEDDTELLRQARDKAFADAKSKAEQYATLTGRTLGRADAVSEVQNGGARPEFAAAAYDTASGGSVATTPISPGQLETTLVVTVRYSLS